MASPADVRPEYEALARDFRFLAAPFDIDVDESLERDLVLIAASFELIDRHVDANPDALSRARLCQTVLFAVRDGVQHDPHHGLDAELSSGLAALRRRLEELRSPRRFAAHLARFFARSEALRQTTNHGEFVRCVIDEARCAAAMTLLVVRGGRAPRFVRFFYVLSEIANLVDKLHDVRDDWSRGEIAVRPTIALRARLLLAFAARLPSLLALARRRFRLLAWGARYLLPP